MKNRNLNHKDEWATPPGFLEQLTQEFDFNFDPCPLHHNTDEWDGLKIEWRERNYVNPPYSDLKATGYLKSSFVKKAIEESQKGKLCVCLLPVSTSTKLFHNFIQPNATEIRFLFKRVKFIGVNSDGIPVSTKCGMHDSMLVIFDGRKSHNIFHNILQQSLNKLKNGLQNH